MSTYELNIDGSGAEAGAERIVKSFDRIREAANRMEGGVVVAANKMVSAFRQLENIRGVGQQAIDRLGALSKAMQNYRGPSKAASDNTIAFLSGLGRLNNVKIPSMAGLGAFLAATNKYTGPTPNAGRNLQSVLNALGKFGGVAGAGARVNQMLQALSNFRGPTANAGRNVERLFTGLANFKGLPRNFDNTIRSFNQLAHSVDRLTSSFGRMQASAQRGLGAINVGAANTAVRQHSGQVRTLVGDHHLLSSAILRTNRAFNALGGILAARSIINAANDVLRIESQLIAATGSANLARVEFKFLQRTTEELGLSFVETARSYGLFLGSVKGTNTSIAEARDIFTGFSIAGRALQLSTQDMDGVFRALGQIISKGKLQAEELRGQLGDRLPGAFVRMAVALNMLPSELDAAMKKGLISGQKLEDGLKTMANNLRIEFADAAETASKTVQAAFNRMNNAFVMAASGLGKSGLNEGIINVTDALTKLLQSDALAITAQALGAVFKFLGDNISLVAAILAGSAISATIKWAAAAAASIVPTTALTAITTAYGRAATVAAGATILNLAPVARLTVLQRAQAAAAGVMAAVNARLAGSFFAVGAAMKAIPFVFLAAAIAGLIYYLSDTATKADLLDQALKEMGSTSVIAEQLTNAYSSSLDANSGTLDANSEALRKNTEEKLRNIAAGTSFGDRYQEGESKLGYLWAAVKSSVGVDMGPRRSGPSKGLMDTSTGRPVDTDYANALRTTGGAIRNQKDFEKFVKDTLYLKSARNQALPGTESASFTTQTDVAAGRLESFVRNPDYYEKTLGFNPAKLVEKMYPGYQNPGSGGANLPPVEPTEKAGGRKKADPGAAAARADEQDVRRAMDQVRDLNREIGNSNAAISALASSGSTAVAVEAAAAAQAQLDNFSDSFATVDRARTGIMEFAAELKAQATGTANAVDQAQTLIAQADAGAAVPVEQLAAAKSTLAGISQQEIDAATALRAANVGTYEGSQAAALAYLTALQQVKSERDKELELSRSIAESEAERATQTGKAIRGTGGTPGVDLVAATLEGGRALRIARIEQEAMNEARGVSIENYDRYVAKLKAEKMAQADLNDELEKAAKLRANLFEMDTLRDEISLRAAGGSDRDITDQLSLRTLQRQLLEDGKSVATVNELVESERQLINMRRAADAARESYTKLQQTAQDMADTIVDGFRQGIESGEGFLTTLGNIFKDLKRTLLDFVLYNPLKQFLQDTLTRSLGGGMGGPLVASGGGTSVTTSGSAGNGVVAGLAAGASLVAGISGGNRGGTIASDGVDYAALNDSLTPRNWSNDDTSIVVNGSRMPLQRLNPIGALNNTANPLQAIKSLYTFKQYGSDGKVKVDGNGNAVTGIGSLSQIKTGFKEIGSAFGSSVKGVGGKLTALGNGLGKVAGAAGAAYAAFTTAQGIGKAVGLGRVGSNVLGGAAAGFTVAGPVGAAIGAGVALVGSLLFNKSPQARASVVVGADGRASAANVFSKSGGNRAGVTDAATGAGTIFSSVASSLGGYLNPGNYGTFGESKKIKGDTKTFYSATGRVDKKGRPIGVAGRDYVIGDPDTINAFALKSQISSGKFGGLDPIYQTIGRNTQAKSVEGINSDLSVGKAYLDFIEAAKAATQLERATQDLTRGYNDLRRQAVALGLETARLDQAFNVMKNRYREDFDFGISQGILGLTDPVKAEYNQLLKDYQNSVRDANAVGGNLAAVEQYYGLQRAELIKKYMEQASNAIKESADDLLRQLTATDSSPLSAQSVFDTARNNYQQLAGEIAGGNYNRFDSLGTFTQDYLSAAQNLFSSSTDYFSVFQQVTDFLRNVSANAPSNMGGGTNPDDLPGLPTIAEMQQKITDSNNALLASSVNVETGVNGVGATLTETNAILAQMLAALGTGGYGSLMPAYAGDGAWGLRTMQTTAASF